MAEHRLASAARSVAIAQIEDAEAVERVDEIIGVDGLDAVFIGRIDLTVSLGCDSPDDLAVESAVGRVVDCCVAAGKPVGMFLPRPADAARWRDRGVRLFLLSSDHQLMRTGAAALRNDAALQ
jgi:2-keto-3-deoxy-L-rhamnonate aldolase RhmA